MPIKSANIKEPICYWPGRQASTLDKMTKGNLQLKRLDPDAAKALGGNKIQANAYMRAGILETLTRTLDSWRPAAGSVSSSGGKIFGKKQTQERYLDKNIDKCEAALYDTLCGKNGENWEKDLPVETLRDLLANVRGVQKMASREPARLPQLPQLRLSKDNLDKLSPGKNPIVQKAPKGVVTFQATRIGKAALKEAAKQLKTKAAKGLGEQAIALAGIAYGCNRQKSPTEVDRAFQAVREKEAAETTNAGLMTKTLSKLLVGFAASKAKDVSGWLTPKAVKDAAKAAEKELKATDAKLINRIDELAGKVLWGQKMEKSEFSRAFTTERERRDAVRILEKLEAAGWRNHEFRMTALPYALVQKAVAEARNIQRDGKELSDKTIWQALVGEKRFWPYTGGTLGAAIDKRMANDVIRACGGGVTFEKGVFTGASKKKAECEAAMQWLVSATSFGLKYDVLLEMIGNPERVPGADDFYDASIRPRNTVAQERNDSQIYGELVFRRPASRYFFNGKLMLDTREYYGVDSKSGSQYEKGMEKALAFAGKLGYIPDKAPEKKLNQQTPAARMMIEMLTQDVGEWFLIAMLGCDRRGTLRAKDGPFFRDFRNYSDFNFIQQDDGSVRLVVTPNKAALNLVGRKKAANADYQFEFLIDKDGNAWVTKQWVQPIKDKPAKAAKK